MPDNTPYVLDLVAKRRPRVVKFPNDHEFPIASYRGSAQSILRQYREESDPIRRAPLLIELLRLAVPTATDDDWASVSMEDWGWIIGEANGTALLVEQALGNGPSGVNEILVTQESNTPLSNQTMP